MKALLRFGAQVMGIGALILAFSAPALAQVTTGTLYGRVVDPSGAVVPEAAVIATNVLTATTKATVTNARGQFTIPFLTVGTYTVTIEAPGFKTLVEEGLEISSGQKVTLTSELEIGALQEVITVRTETPLLNMASAEQDIHVTSAMVKELPVNRRDITQLLNTGPGTNASWGTVSLNGLPARGFTFTVDGVEATSDSELPSLGLYQDYNYIKGVSMDAVKEVEVSKNIFSAEIGMTVSGNVNIITKSGTNTFQGSTFWNYQSGGLNARDHFTAEKVSEVFHQFGASLGGPVIKDKLFFFGAFEGYRLTKMEPMSGYIPSRWIREATIAAIPASQAYFHLWPQPTGPEEPGDTEAFYVGSHPRTRDDNHIVARLDYNLGASDYLSARYTRGRPNALEPRLALGNPRDRRGEVENVAFNWTKVLGPTTSSELRFGWNRNSTDRVDRFVEVGIPGMGDVIPETWGELFIKSGSNWSLENTWALVRGRHSVKFGGLARIGRASRINQNAPMYEYASVEDLLANWAYEAWFALDLEEFLIKSWEAGVFIQDDFRLTPSLMLNLGLRWDYSAVPRERDRRFFNRDGPFGGADQGSDVVRYRDPDSAWNAKYNMFSPRVGFAWSLDERTVLRGGAGIFYIPFNLFAGPVEIVQNALGEPVYFGLEGSALDELGIRYPDGNDVVKPLVEGASDCDPVALTCATTGYISDTSIDPDRENAYSIQWTLGVSRQLTDTVAFDVAYVGNHGVKLTYSPEINRIDRVSGLRPVAGFGGFWHYSQEDSSVYHSLQTSLRKRFANNLGFGLHYTYASNLSYWRGEFTCCGSSLGPQDLDNLRANRGPTPYFLRHRFFGDFLYELPLSGSLFLEGWQVGGLIEIRSGYPLHIIQAQAPPGARPHYLGERPQDSVRDDWRTPLDDGMYQYLDTSLYEVVPRDPVSRQAVRAGTLGRNAVTGPGYWSVDLALSKNFRFERTRLQLRVDLFNAFNHTNLDLIQDRADRRNFGQIISTYPGRVTQLSVRLDF